MNEKAHALLSASGAHRWLNCPPSARLEETFPESTSEFAEEGRLAHEIAELKLRKHFVEPIGPRSFNAKLKKLQKDPLFQDEMLQHTDAYKDYLSGITHAFTLKPYVAIEKRLDFSSYVPDGFGTGDAIIIGSDTLYVVDFKYGKGQPVYAEDNPQMKLYALGAWCAYGLLFPISKVKLVIFQPRLDNISEFEMPIEDLLAWGESIKPIAQLAYDGGGEYQDGEHCKFCRAKMTCRKRTETHAAALTAVEAFEDRIPGFKSSPEILSALVSNAEIGGYLERCRKIAKWLSELDAYALGQCLAGNEIPGWKAVEGRGSRQYRNQDEAFAVLTQNGIDEAVLYIRSPLSVAAVEKLLGGYTYRTLLEDSGQIIKQPGKPTLVPVTDKREAIIRSSAAEVFKNEGGIENE